jgi:hypothetical protein
MKALSVRQPWATKISNGEKTLEIRSWRTHYRGPLLIVASARKCGGLPVGCALCVVELLDCRPMVPGDAEAACCEYQEGAWAWEVRLVSHTLYTPIKGKLSLYEVPVGSLT